MIDVDEVIEALGCENAMLSEEREQLKAKVAELEAALKPFETAVGRSTGRIVLKMTQKAIDREQRIAELEAEVARLQAPEVVREMAGRIVTFRQTNGDGPGVWWAYSLDGHRVGGGRNLPTLIQRCLAGGHIVDYTTLPADVRAALEAS